MPAIKSLRPVLLSAPYATPRDLEVRLHLPSGTRSCGMVEVTLDDGTVGVGEGYLAVFAPRVFAEVVELLAPYLVGKDALDIAARYRDLCGVCDYWSMQGAARHAISAVEIALYDAAAKRLGVPVYQLLGGRAADAIPLYGSGGDSATSAQMDEEIELLRDRDIRLFKIRARNHESAKAAWTLDRAAAHGIDVAVDMTQNLANPAQTVSDVVQFLDRVRTRTARPIFFLEEPLGPLDRENWRLLRSRTSVRICGGETVTTAAELAHRLAAGFYDLTQPDATVIGGIGQTMEVFAAGRHHGIGTVVHCWGGAAGMMANYHAAFAGNGPLVEWPMKRFPLREAMLAEPLRFEGGRLLAPQAPGLGVRLSEEIEREYAFRPDAVYRCLRAPQSADASPADAWDS